MLLSQRKAFQQDLNLSKAFFWLLGSRFPNVAAFGEGLTVLRFGVCQLRGPCQQCLSPGAGPALPAPLARLQFTNSTCVRRSAHPTARVDRSRDCSAYRIERVEEVREKSSTPVRSNLKVEVLAVSCTKLPSHPGERFWMISSSSTIANLTTLPKLRLLVSFARLRRIRLSASPISVSKIRERLSSRLSR